MVYYIISVIFSVMYGLIMLETIMPFMNIFQLNGYKTKTTLHWLVQGNNISSTIKVWKKSLLALVVTGVVVLVADIDILKVYYLLYIVLLIMVYIIYKCNKKVEYKKPLVKTTRVIRTSVVYVIVVTCFASVVCYISLQFNNVWWYLLLIALYAVCELVLFLANCINLPLQQVINHRYIMRAIRVLRYNKNLKVVGITGSYGKTSVKFILTKILKEKYFATCTPNSYNTPLGITKTILNNLKPHHEIFVVEMGADHLNDIDKICKIVKPDISVLTSIGHQHLSTFKTFDNIVKTKYQIVKNTHKNGFSVFNIDNKTVSGLHCYTLKPKVGVAIDDKSADCYASNIKISSDGLEFYVNYKKKRFKLNSKLLGRHNITNILLSVVVAIELGVEVYKIKRAVKSLQPTKSRLELITHASGALILNDSFNSNPQGCKNAVEVLESFDDRIKVIITPGMVELGKKQYDENYKFAQSMAGVADAVYIVNDINKDAISKGLLAAGFDSNNIKYSATFDKAFMQIQQFLTNKHILLIENDLPDNYK